MNNNQIAELLVEQQVFPKAQIDDILEEANLNGKTLAQTMVDNGLVDESGFYQTIASSLGMDYVPLQGDIPPHVLKLIPSGLVRLHRALPLGSQDGSITVALVDPFDLQAAEDLRFALGKEIDVVVSPTDQVEERIKKYYGTDTSSMQKILQQLGEPGELLTLRADEGTTADVEAGANATPIIRFVDLILFQAIQDRASDIHFEPF